MDEKNNIKSGSWFGFMPKPSKFFHAKFMKFLYM